MALFSRSPQQQRDRLLRRGVPEPLTALFRTPLPSPDTPAERLPLLAVDVETTGLDPSAERLLSIGWVPVDALAVHLGGAGQVVLASDAEVGQSATFHGITDDQVARGVPTEQALTRFLEALTGRVLLAHYATMEVEFIGRACERVWGVRPPFAVVDTMDLQYRLLTKGMHTEPPRGALRLWGARDQYGLPRYQAHEALTDALACAELFLAQVAELGERTTLSRLG